MPTHFLNPPAPAPATFPIIFRILSLIGHSSPRCFLTYISPSAFFEFTLISCLPYCFSVASHGHQEIELHVGDLLDKKTNVMVFYLGSWEPPFKALKMDDVFGSCAIKEQRNGTKPPADWKNIPTLKIDICILAGPWDGSEYLYRMERIRYYGLIKKQKATLS